MFAFLAALSQAGGILVDKIILTRRQVEIHVFTPILFLFLFLLTSLLFPFLGKVSSELFSPYYLIIFLGMLLTAIIWNFFYYRGVRSEKIHEFELIIMAQPLLTILLATIFLKGERNIHIEIAAFIAAIALIIAHIRKKHLELSKASIGLIIAIIFMSIELILIKLLLNVFSPVALYSIRTGIIFIFFYFYFKPQMFRASNINVLLILLTSFLGVVQMVSKFYGFEQFGVIYTSLILILSPLLVYIISTIFMHEHLKARTVISALVILGCIVYATVLGR